MEGQSGGLGKFWKQITGQAAREAAMQEQLREQQRLENEAQLKDLRQQFDGALKAAFQIPKVDVPEGTNYEEEVRRIAESIRATRFHAKFPVGTVINGINCISSQDFSDSGNNLGELPERSFTSPSRAFSVSYTFIEALLGSGRDDTQEMEFNNNLNHLIFAVNHSNGKDAVINYGFRDQHHDIYDRATYCGSFYFLMPKGNAYNLLAMIRQNGDTAESFVQQAARGFERKPGGTYTDPGIARYTADHVAIVDLSRLPTGIFNPVTLEDKGRRTPREVIQRGSGIVPRQLRDHIRSNNSFQTNANNWAEFFPYSQVHGVK